MQCQMKTCNCLSIKYGKSGHGIISMAAVHCCIGRVEL
jgi:hypothetical protein